jgi:hypothetical protein
VPDILVGHYAGSCRIENAGKTAGILAPLVISEVVKDNEQRWRWIRLDLPPETLPMKTGVVS